MFTYFTPGSQRRMEVGCFWSTSRGKCLTVWRNSGRGTGGRWREEPRRRRSDGSWNSHCFPHNLLMKNGTQTLNWYRDPAYGSVPSHYQFQNMLIYVNLWYSWGGGLFRTTFYNNSYSPIMNHTCIFLCIVKSAYKELIGAMQISSLLPEFLVNV